MCQAGNLTYVSLSRLTAERWDVFRLESLTYFRLSSLSPERWDVSAWKGLDGTLAFLG